MEHCPGVYLNIVIRVYYNIIMVSIITWAWCHFCLRLRKMKIHSESGKFTPKVANTLLILVATVV